MKYFTDVFDDVFLCFQKYNQTVLTQLVYVVMNLELSSHNEDAVQNSKTCWGN